MNIRAARRGSVDVALRSLGPGIGCRGVLGVRMAFEYRQLRHPSSLQQFPMDAHRVAQKRKGCGAHRQRD